MGGRQTGNQFVAYVQESLASRPQQVLQHSADCKVDIELLHVNRQRADRLIAVQHHLRAFGVRQLDDTGNVELGAIAEADVRDGHELSFFVDQLLEVLERNVAVRGPGNVHNTCATQLLCMPDLRVGRELEV